MSFDPTNPKDIFGGEWEQIKDRFIYAAGEKTVNATGGEENHTLTGAEMPAHAHQQIAFVQGYSGCDTYTTTGPEIVFDIANNGNRNFFSKGTTLHVANVNHNSDTDTVGKNQAYNNMPPYIVVYIWKRIK